MHLVTLFSTSAFSTDTAVATIPIATMTLIFNHCYSSTTHLYSFFVGFAVLLSSSLLSTIYALVHSYSAYSPICSTFIERPNLRFIRNPSFPFRPSHGVNTHATINTTYFCHTINIPNYISTAVITCANRSLHLLSKSTFTTALLKEPAEKKFSSVFRVTYESRNRGTAAKWGVALAPRRRPVYHTIAPSAVQAEKEEEIADVGKLAERNEKKNQGKQTQDDDDDREEDNKGTVDEDFELYRVPKQMAKIISEFNAIRGGIKAKTSELCAIGENLPQLPEHHRISSNKVPGCQSTVYVIAKAVKNGENEPWRIYFGGDSGLSGLTVNEIDAIRLDFGSLFGLENIVAMSRINGFMNMTQKMKRQAALAEHAAKQPNTPPLSFPDEISKEKKKQEEEEENEEESDEMGGALEERLQSLEAEFREENKNEADSNDITDTTAELSDSS